VSTWSHALWHGAPAVVFAALVCPLAAAEFPCDIVLRDATAESGVTFVHTDGSSGRLWMFEAMSAGVAVLDYDNDGDLDIYFLNGAPLKGANPPEPPRNALYRNDGDFRFTDVTEEAGVGDTGYGLGVAVGDYDNDGHSDVYVNNYGPNVLYRNSGDGTFADVTGTAGVANGRLVGAGANWLDADGDGDLDLFVSNYIRWTYERNVVMNVRGYHAYSGPRDYPKSLNTFYRNNGDGTFTDVTEASGIADYPGAGMGTCTADFDNDGDTDIFVGNDDYGNSLFRNDGTGRFDEVGLEAGFAYDLEGNAHSSMGVTCADYDNDGWLDFHVTSYQDELATLYRNVKGEFFDDVTRLTGAGVGTKPHVTWGNGFADFDNDGDRDLWVNCGHLQPYVERYDDTTSYRALNVLLMNTGNGRFVNVSKRAGDGMKVSLVSRGAAFGDLDNDGDVDVVILNSRAEPTLLRNDSATGNHWLQVRLRGTTTNRDGIGAHVRVTAGGRTQLDEVHSGIGYQSHYGMWLHFGLGPHETVDRIEVLWIGGGTDVMRDVPADQILTITEGSHPAPKR
jgi:hypothetical protein